MSSFNVSGLSTGVDYNDLIEKLIEVKRGPIKILESKKTDYSDKVTSYSDLSSKLSTLKSAVDNLKTERNFYVKNASVDDTTKLDASASGSAAIGNYTVEITTLASEEKEAHAGLAASSSVVNSSGSDKVFSYTYGSTTTSVTVADGTTLDQLKALINNDTNNPGVTATIVNDGVGGDNYRLMLTGNETGEDNTIAIDDTNTTLDGTGGTENFESTAFTQTKQAADADFKVDGLQINRSSNSISDVIEGVTINLKQAASTGVISVTADSDGIKEQINTFVTAYNDIMDFLATNMDYDEATGISGILSGESTARNVQTQLRSMISGTVSGLSGDLSVLAQVGITTDYKTGNLVVDDTTLDDMLASNLDDIADLFTDNTNGIATKVYDYISNITSTVDGALSLREKGLNSIIDNITDTITRMEYRLDKTEDDLVRKFTSLEMLVSNFNTIGAYLTNFSTLA